MVEKQIEIRKLNNELYEVFQNGNSLGFIKLSRNKFHAGNLYLQLQLTSYDKEFSKELLTLLQQEHNEPFQIMCNSTEKEMIEFIETAGFVCKRKCYECEVTKADVRIDDRQEMLQNALLYSCFSEAEYLDASKLLYQQYADKHATINPVTASFEEFLEILPKDVYVEINQGKINNFAFVEENEIAYVGSCEKETYRSFLMILMQTIFAEYETICFECDDGDWDAMCLKELFSIEDNESYNTYILERTEK